MFCDNPSGLVKFVNPAALMRTPRAVDPTRGGYLHGGMGDACGFRLGQYAMWLGIGCCVPQGRGKGAFITIVQIFFACFSNSGKFGDKPLIEVLPLVPVTATMVFGCPQ